MKIFSLFILLLCHLTIHAQVPVQIGARANGMANTTLLISDVWAVRNNIGSIGMLDKTEVGLSYQNRFFLKEFANQSVAFNYASEQGSFGVYFQQTGFSLYRQMIGGVGYGMKLSDNFSTGVSLNYQRINFGDIYGSVGSVSASVGLFYQLNKSIDLGVNISNINRAKIDDYQDERFPTVFNLGMRYKFSEGTFWSIEAEKDLLHPINIKSGIEIEAHEIFLLRLGMNSYPFQTAFGVGLKMKNWRLDIATSWHSSLGINPSAGLVYQLE
jgi:hypothetical protein